MHTWHDPMYTSVESSYLLYLQNQCTVIKRKQDDTSVYMAISPGAPHTFPVVFPIPVQDCLVVLDVAALQHAVCDGLAPQTG